MYRLNGSTTYNRRSEKSYFRLFFLRSIPEENKTRSSSETTKRYENDRERSRTHVHTGSRAYR